MTYTIIIFTLFSVIAKGVGFGRELVLSYYYGASEISDIFLLSITLPGTMFGFVSAGIISGFIPLYQKVLRETGKSGARRFSNNVLNTTVLFSFFLIIVYYILSRYILRLFASGFSMDAIGHAMSFTNITICAIPLVSVVTVLTGYLQINDKIQITALTSVPLNVVIIIAITISFYSKQYIILPVGFLIASIVQAIILILISIKEGFLYDFTLDLKDSYLLSFMSGVGILTISGSITQINIIVDRSLATMFTGGGLSLFEYGSRINDLVIGLTIIPINSALFPSLTKEALDEEGFFAIKVEEAMNIFCIVILPLSAFICVFSEPFVQIVYLRGAFDNANVKNTASIVFFYGIGLFAFAIRDLFNKTFYAMGNMKTPMLHATLSLGLNIILNLLLIKPLGLGGLALATSISAYLSIVMLQKPLKKCLGEFMDHGRILKCMSKTLLITSICIVVTFFILKLFLAVNYNNSVSFVIATIFFCCLYVLLMTSTGMLGVKKSNVKK